MTNPKRGAPVVLMGNKGPVYARVEKVSHGNIRVVYVVELVARWINGPVLWAELRVGDRLVQTVRHRCHYHVRIRDEGITWARGYDNEAVKALRAVAAISP